MKIPNTTTRPEQDSRLVKSKPSRKGDELLTYNPKCRACMLRSEHPPKAWKKYHPLAGTGYQADTAPINRAKQEVKPRS